MGGGDGEELEHVEQQQQQKYRVTLCELVLYYNAIYSYIYDRPTDQLFLWLLGPTHESKGMTWTNMHSSNQMCLDTRPMIVNSSETSATFKRNDKGFKLEQHFSHTMHSQMFYHLHALLSFL